MNAASPLSDDGLPPLRDVIRQFGLRAKKSLGQNFLLDLNLTRRIARLCGDLQGRDVIEIGPGPGGLTRALLHEGARNVIAIERDQRCRHALEMIAAHWPDGLTVIEDDALKLNLSTIARNHALDPAETFVISNLPYGIATRLLVGWLEETTWPPRYAGMGLMFQKEVAERIVAEPETKAYGRLAVISQWSCDVRLALNVPAAAFTPQPKVDSAVVTFVPKPKRLPACSVLTLGRVTAAAFGQRRKMLRVSLKQLTPMPELLLETTNISPTLRAEQIDVEAFARLAQALDGPAAPLD
ncbi:MAG: 16S rRNA (adenine(1518)-N(6)/adenine(1519)-N(6))-dimethyltransferase RsmA [Hyphomicrobiaceae bacterium]